MNSTSFRNTLKKTQFYSYMVYLKKIIPNACVCTLLQINKTGFSKKKILHHLTFH